MEPVPRQIYIPIVNWLLAAGTLGAVITFGSSDALGGAYGIAVSMLMAVTTVLAGLVALHWGFSPLIVAAVNGFFLVVDLIFVAANATKLLEGGWFPLLLAGLVAFLMLTWRTGYLLLEQQRSRLRQREGDFVEWVLANPPIRLPGAAAIFSAASSGIPLALTHHLRTQPRPARARAADQHRQLRRAAYHSGPAGEARPGRRRNYSSYSAVRIYGTPQCDGRAEARLPQSRAA